LIDVATLQKILSKPKLLAKQPYNPLPLAMLKDVAKETSIATVEQTKKLKLIVFLNYLMKLYEAPFFFQTLPDKASELGIPFPIMKSLATKFYEEIPQADSNKMKYARSSLLVDRLICYIIVVALIISDFLLNVNLVAQAMKLEQKK
jgi:hypothetical protein